MADFGAISGRRNQKAVAGRDAQVTLGDRAARQGGDRDD